MKYITSKPGYRLSIGRQGENLAVGVQFDITGWRDLYGEGTVQLIVQRNGDEAPYPAPLTVGGDTAIWEITSADTAKAGYGSCELRYYVGDVLAKSEIWTTYVASSLGEPSEVPPVPYQSWVDAVLQAGTDAQKGAQDAAESASAAGNAAEEAKTAQSKAEDAQTKAEASKEASIKSETAVKLSEQSAKASEDAAKASEKASAGSASAAANSATAAQTAQSRAEAAKTSAEQSAQQAAESAAVYDSVVSDVTQLKSDLTQYNTVNILPKYVYSKSFTSKGVTFEYVDGKTWNISGDATGYPQIALILSTSEITEVMKPDDLIEIRFSCDDEEVIIRVIETLSDDTQKTTDITANTTFKVDTNTVSFNIYIRGKYAVPSGSTRRYDTSATVEILSTLSAKNSAAYFDEKIGNIGKRLDTDEARILALENKPSGGDIVEPIVIHNRIVCDMVGGWIRSTDGKYRNSLQTSYCASDFVKVPDDTDIMFASANARPNGGCWALYDANKVFIPDAYGYTHIIKPIDGAKYVRVTHNGAFDGTTYPQTYIEFFAFGSESPKNVFEKVCYPLRGKVIAFSGDSVTYGYDDLNDGYQLANPWTYQVGEKLKTTVLNYGMSSASLMDIEGTRQAIISEYQNYADEVDIIGFQIGINDWFRDYSFGTVDDTDSTTFLGCLNLLIQGALEKWKPSDGKRIFLMTYFHDDQNSASSVSWENWIDGIKAVAKKHSIPVCDTYDELGITVENDTNGDYWKLNGNSHSAHLKQLGANVFAEYVASWLSRTFG